MIPKALIFLLKIKTFQILRIRYHGTVEILDSSLPWTPLFSVCLDRYRVAAAAPLNSKVQADTPPTTAAVHTPPNPRHSPAPDHKPPDDPTTPPPAHDNTDAPQSPQNAETAVATPARNANAAPPDHQVMSGQTVCRC